MKYKAKLTELLANNDSTAFDAFIKSHEPLEQIEIMKQFKQMCMNKMFKSQNFSNAENLKLYDEKIKNYEDAILLAIEVKALVELIQTEKEKVMQRIIAASSKN